MKTPSPTKKKQGKERVTHSPTSSSRSVTPPRQATPSSSRSSTPISGLNFGDGIFSEHGEGGLNTSPHSTKYIASGSAEATQSELETPHPVQQGEASSVSTTTEAPVTDASLKEKTADPKSTLDIGRKSIGWVDQYLRIADFDEKKNKKDPLLALIRKIKTFPLYKSAILLEEAAEKSVSFESEASLFTELYKELDKRDKAKTSHPQDMLTNKYWQDKWTTPGTVDQSGKPVKRPLETGGKYWNDYATNAGSHELKQRQVRGTENAESIAGTIGKDLLKDLETQGTQANAQQLKVYRTMPEDDANNLLTWFKHKGRAAEDKIRQDGEDVKDDEIMPIQGHLGDLPQALGYKGVTLEFILKPNADKLLFSPQYMAIAYAGDHSSATRNLALLKEAEHAGKVEPQGKAEKQGKAAKGKEKQGEEEKQPLKYFPKANTGEGSRPGYIGMKSEENGFSLSLTAEKEKLEGKGKEKLESEEEEKELHKSKPSRLLFQLFVQDIRTVPR